MGTAESRSNSILSGGGQEWTLSGGQSMTGSATNNSQSDIFNIYGTGNSVLEPFGNLLAIGGDGTPLGFGWDSKTKIAIGGVGVTDIVSLDGGGNTLGNAPQSALSNANVSYTVAGNNGTAGGNRVALVNANGNTTVALGGSNNDVTLAGATNTVTIGGSGTVALTGTNSNTVTTGGPATVTLAGATANDVVIGGSGTAAVNGNAANSITFGAGGATAIAGVQNDDMFGFQSVIALSGDGNSVFGGDENFVISGAAGGNLIVLGDGANRISFAGAGNVIAIGGGQNTINAGGGSTSVAILGRDGLFSPTFAPERDDTPFVTASPTDTITIAGANNFVVASYENLVIFGAGVTANATITAGDGNNSLMLGGSGGNTVTLGNGTNSIVASGNGGIYSVGNGQNGIALNGNNNSVAVVDPTGKGTVVLQLGPGTGNGVNFGAAGGSITGDPVAAGNTVVLQTGPRAVTVNLNKSTGTILLGDGNDSVTAGGDNSTFVLGNGNDTVTAGATNGSSGAGDIVIAGDGNDTVSANGVAVQISLGNGNSTVTAAGDGDFVSTGNGSSRIAANGHRDTIVAGDGNNTVSANGNDDTIALGDGNNVLTANGGGLNETIGLGRGNNTVTANGLHARIAIGTFDGSGGNTVTANGNGDTISIGTKAPPGLHSNGVLSLTARGTGDTIAIFAARSTSSANTPNRIEIGGGSTLSVSGGTAVIHAMTGDTFHLNGLGFGSEVFETGNGNMTFLGSNASAIVHLDPAATSNIVAVQALTGSGAYTGAVEVSGFTGTDVMDLQGLFGANGLALAGSGAALFGAVMANMTTGPAQATLALKGGGSIAFDLPMAAFTTASFVATNHTGPA